MSENEPLWRVSVEVPMRLPVEVRHELFGLVAALVHDWEQAYRDDWDANVYGCPAPDDVPSMEMADLRRDAEEVRKYWRDWPAARRSAVGDLSRFLAGAIGNLAAGLDRLDETAPRPEETP